jgi:hypothetical protein
MYGKIYQKQVTIVINLYDLSHKIQKGGQQMFYGAKIIKGVRYVKGSDGQWYILSEQLEQKIFDGQKERLING